MQDYRWWWRSFIVSGGSAVYVLFYSIFYFFTKLDITEFIPTLLYFGYTSNFNAFFTSIYKSVYSTLFFLGLMVLTFWLLTGTIGFFAAYSFIRKIYSAVKIDWFSFQFRKIATKIKYTFTRIIFNQKKLSFSVLT